MSLQKQDSIPVYCRINGIPDLDFPPQDGYAARGMMKRRSEGSIGEWHE